MTRDPIIRVEGLSKRYSIRHEAQGARYLSLRDEIAARARSVMTLGRKREPLPNVEEFWALKDVSFEVAEGEVVGVVGRNGAGKSTLLKVLSRITEPTAGRVTLTGRVSSLLEVGTGFHPELTGRENIFLNGSVLGMSRAEVRRKFDEIVAFAEVERFLDTPVKRYSSGMYMRLAFAVAAHMEPEILIVDEVLAVGDSEFQKKCLGKMGEVSKAGRTVLFVSHNIGALLAICDGGLLLDRGQLIATGTIADIAERYSRQHRNSVLSLEPRQFSGPLRSVTFQRISINGAPMSAHQSVTPEEGMTVVVEGTSTEALDGMRLGMDLFSNGVRVLSLHDGPERLSPCPFRTTFTIPPRLLRPGEYWLALGGSRHGGADWTWATDVACVEVMARWADGYDAADIGLVNVAGGAVRSQSVAPPDCRPRASSLG